jgi:hypothetical protein
MSSSLKRGFLMRISVVVALAVAGFSVLHLAIRQRMSVHNVELRGLAQDYRQLAVTPVIGKRISYFPRAAKNIEYWCRPYSNGINGSFDIGENDFLDWAHSMGWQPKELRPTQLEPTFQVMHADGSEESLDFPKRCYFFKHQVVEKSGQFRRDFRMMYDRTRKRAYFTDSPGRRGPPVLVQRLSPAEK